MEQIQIDTQNQQQVLAYELIANTNSSFFLTGRAGTGKTTFLRNVQKNNTTDFFFYKADAIKRMRLVKIEFQKVYRQDDDQQFLQILENVRMNKVTADDIIRLNSRVAQPKSEDGMVITLASVNKTADTINQQRLAEIDSKEFTYEGIIKGRFDEKKLPVDLNLRLKVGAQVMFTRNDAQKRWANGTLAKVVNLKKNEILVALGNGETCTVPCAS